MSRIRRAWNILAGAAMIFFALLLFIAPEEGYDIMVLVLLITLLARGIGQLIYYFTMARFAIGGIMTFYKAVFLIDAALFALGLQHVPPVYVKIYLIMTMAIGGIIDVLRANEARRMESGHWRYQFTYGLVTVVIALVCGLFLRQEWILTIIFGAGLVHSGVSRIVTACRKSAIVYVR